MKGQVFKKTLVVLMAFALIIGGMGIGQWNLEAAYAGSQYNWSNSYRGDYSNMTVIGGDVVSKIPTSVDGANVKWATQVGITGSSVKNATTHATFMDGKLYVLGNETVKQLDAETGEILKTSVVKTSNLYNYYLVNDGQYLYVQAGTSVIALDADLNKVWESEKFEGTQGLCQLYCKDGKIYGGTWSGKASTESAFFCINAADGTTVWKYVDTAVGGIDGGSGAYWTGANVIGNYVVIGSESGKLYAFDKDTGIAAGQDPCIYDTNSIKTVAAYDMSIRGSVATDGESIYFTAGNNKFGANLEGYVFKAKFNGQTGQIEGEVLRASIGYSVSAPSAYNGRLYVAGSGTIYVLSSDTLETYYSYKTNLGKCHDVNLVVNESTKEVYGFTTYNYEPGSVLCLKDAPGQTEAQVINFGPVTQSAAKQYSAAQVIVGEDGTLYMTNDSGVLVALEKNDAYITSMTAGAGFFTNEIASYTLENELAVPVGSESAEVEIKASEGSKIYYGGQEVTDGKISISLLAKAVSAEVKIVNGSDERVYTINVREQSTETGITVAVGSSNAVSSISSVIPKAGNAYLIENVTNSTNRTFIGLNDSKAAVQWEILSGTNKSLSNVTGTNISKDDVDYHKRVLWGTNYADTTLAKLTVTAEDKVTTSEYYIVVTSGDASTYKLAKTIELSDTNVVLTEDVTSKNLTAEVTEYSGTASEMTYDKTIWSSSDEKVVTVDENGKVTAVGKGTAAITVTNGPATATCTVTVASPEADITDNVNIPETGDGSNLVMWTVIMCLAAVAVYIISRRSEAVDK